jgi:hypothetical protein
MPALCWKESRASETPKVTVPPQAQQGDDPGASLVAEGVVRVAPVGLQKRSCGPGTAPSGPVSRRLAEARSEGLLVRLADGAPRRRDQPDQVGDPCPVNAGAGIVEADVAVAVQGEQDGVSESPRGSLASASAVPVRSSPGLAPTRISGRAPLRANRSGEILGHDSRHRGGRTDRRGMTGVGLLN